MLGFDNGVGGRNINYVHCTQRNLMMFQLFVFDIADTNEEKLQGESFFTQHKLGLRHRIKLTLAEGLLESSEFGDVREHFPWRSIST